MMNSHTHILSTFNISSVLLCILTGSYFTVRAMTSEAITDRPLMTVLMTLSL